MLRRLLCATLCATLCAAPLAARGPQAVERHLGAMGTDLTVEVEADTRAQALEASEAAVRAIEEIEARLSTWRDSSELSALNSAAAGQPQALTVELAADLALARALWRETEGAFDPGVGALVRAWGLREGGRLPDCAELEAALEACGMAGLQLDQRAATRLNEGLVIEEGGFGKGLALDAALAVLAEAGVRSAIIDLGGQVAVLTGAQTSAVSYGVAHPRERQRSVARITLERGSLATSGNSERGIEIEGRRVSHILNPHTGRPAADFGSVTVWAEEAVRADALSTALFVMGPDAGLAWAEASSGVEALFLIHAGDDLSARATSGWGERLTMVSGDPLVREAGVNAAALPAAASFDSTDVVPDRDDLEQRLAALEQELEAVTEDLERISLGELIPALGDATGGLGPAASKVYNQNQGLSIGGYGEALFQAFEDADNVFDFVRAVVYVGYKFDEDWVFNSEIEVEHADEVFLEFAYLEYLGLGDHAARAGLLLIPMGFLNELHEPTTYLAATRPDTERKIIPSTWRENGVGLRGDMGPVEYRLALVGGLDAAGFTDEGLRGGRQKGSKALAEDFALVGRLDYVDVPGLILGGSFYAGESDQDQAGFGDNQTTILELHAELRQDGYWLRALAARAEVDDVDQLNAALDLVGAESVGEELEGFYVEGGYDVMGWIDPDSTWSVSPYLRWESINTQAAVPAGFSSDPANDETVMSVGLNVSPTSQLVFKLEAQDRDRGSDSINFGMGYVF